VNVLERTTVKPTKVWLELEGQVHSFSRLACVVVLQEGTPRIRLKDYARVVWFLTKAVVRGVK
jgi:hypothetical protein